MRCYDCTHRQVIGGYSGCELRMPYAGPTVHYCKEFDSKHRVVIEDYAGRSMLDMRGEAEDGDEDDI